MDLGMSELLVIGIAALIFIGPKDLPKLFQTMGRFTAKMRAMAREFTSAMEAAAEESGVKDVAKDLRAVTSPQSMGLDKVSEAMDRFEKWDPLKGQRPSGNPTLSPAPKPSPTPTLAQAPTSTSAAPKPAPAAPSDAATATSAPPPAAQPNDDKPRGPATAAIAARNAAQAQDTGPAPDAEPQA